MENYEQIKNMLFSENREDQILGAKLAFLNNVPNSVIVNWFNQEASDRGWYFKLYERRPGYLLVNVIPNEEESKLFVIVNDRVCYTSSPFHIQSYLESWRSELSST